MVDGWRSVALQQRGRATTVRCGKKGEFPEVTGEGQGYKLSGGHGQRVRAALTRHRFFFHEDASLQQSEASDVRLVRGRGGSWGGVQEVWTPGWAMES